jgi:hypothetical protein
VSAQIFVPLLFGGLLLVYAGIAVVTWRGTRGRRIVKCPGNGKLAAVELDTTHATVTALFESADLRIKSCSRWPDHDKCHQGCLREAASAPPESRS